jgi:hypothetical protein
VTAAPAPARDALVLIVTRNRRRVRSMRAPLLLSVRATAAERPAAIVRVVRPIRVLPARPLTTTRQLGPVPGQRTTWPGRTTIRPPLRDVEARAPELIVGGETAAGVGGGGGGGGGGGW